MSEAPRKRGRPKKILVNVDVSSDASPLEYMLAVMRDDRVDPMRRDRMAIAAAPYVHDKPSDRALGKKEQAAIDAQTAHEGTQWEGLMERFDRLN